MNSDAIVTASGEVLFFWDSGDEERHMLVNIAGDDHHKPDAFELTGELRDAAIGAIEEGARIEIDYRLERREMVDPGGSKTFGTTRPNIIAVRIIGD